MRVPASWFVPLLLSAATACCAAAPESPRRTVSDADYPWELLPSGVLTQDFVWRQRITAAFQGQRDTFHAVLQAAGGQLSVIGLSPMGSKSFLLRQVGTDVSFETFLEEQLPFPSRFILIDIQRCFFPLGGLPAVDSGLRRFEQGGEIVEELWQSGHLLSRRFHRPGFGMAGRDILVRYEEWAADGATPRLVILDNGWFDYRLTILSSPAGD